MYRIGDYIYVESIDELKSRSVWYKGDDIGVIGIGMFHDVLNVTYPHVFKIHESPDTHCCDDCYPCLNRDMIKAVDDFIDKHKREIEDLRNLRKTLKENI
jgi:hypothetical protein